MTTPTNDLKLRAALAVVLGIEADGAPPGDPGGETKWGVARNRHPEITEARWAAWTEDDSIALLAAQYYDAHRCGEMPWSWAVAIFDGEVNQGSVITVAQNALGVVPADGVVGPGTLAAIRSATDEHLSAFFAGRELKYQLTPGYAANGRGWVRRLFLVALAAARTPQNPVASAARPA